MIFYYKIDLNSPNLRDYLGLPFIQFNYDLIKEFSIILNY